ncbi:MAG: FtsX-like permease family protein [Luteitalea sp.]|nr:FtsX-like permease family protein [Luteitalea sp.]
MRILREWIHRLWGTLHPRQSDRDLEQELHLHLELAAEEARHRSHAPDDARRAARIQAGGAPQAMDALRDQRGLPWLDDLVRDVRHGLRMLRRSPAFTAVALLTVALGIGANTAIFSVVNGIILRPLEYPKPEQLICLTAHFPILGITEFTVSNPEYVEFREMNRSFANVGAFTTGDVNLIADDRPLRVRSASVDEHLLDVLGVQVAHGRFFARGETDAMAARPGVGGPPIAILSDELWQTAFGGQPLVGQTVDVEGRPHEILGIMPPGADIMDNRTQIWLPLGLHPARSRNRVDHGLYVVGRLKDGVTAQGAQTELNALLENWGERVGATGHVPTKRPSRSEDHILQMQPMHDAIVGDASRAIWVLQAAVGLVLLIACANLANLVMARAESRRREFAVRAALGASRGRLLRQTMTEGVLLSVAGGVLGLWLARAAVQALVRAYPTSLPRTSDIAIDVPVLLFALGVSMGTGVLFGLVPVAQRRVNGLVTALKESGDRGTSGAGHHHIRRALVMAEVALAVMLVVGAALLVRTVYNLTRVDAGFDRSRLVTFSMRLPMAASEPDTRAQAYQRVLDRLRAAPGLQAATAMSGLPLNRSPQGFDTRIANYSAPTGEPFEVVDFYQFVMSDYFETMGIPIVAGRGFERTDIASPGRVVVVNETLANAIWKGRNPIGQRLRPDLIASLGDGGRPWHTVIGVAGDVKQGGVDRETGTELYIFAEQQANAPPTMNVVLRTRLPPAALSRTLERVVREVDPAVPIARLRDMDAVFAESIRRPRLLAQLLGAFAGLALLLAAVGTYGVLSYMVTERRREIGIRIALGADCSSVLALVMKQGLQLTIIGVAVGLAGALGLNRLIASLLFGVQPTDTATLVTVTAAITLVAAFACWLPAWRASRLDPNVVLRAD